LSFETRASGHGEIYPVIVYTEAGKRFSIMRHYLRDSPDKLCHACFIPGTFSMRCIFMPVGLS
jgi:hypothetical protein